MRGAEARAGGGQRGNGPHLLVSNAKVSLINQNVCFFHNHSFAEIVSSGHLYCLGSASF